MQQQQQQQFERPHNITHSRRLTLFLPPCTSHSNPSLHHSLILSLFHSITQFPSHSLTMQIGSLTSHGGV